MKKYITSKSGKRYCVDFFGVVNRATTGGRKEGTTAVEIRGIDNVYGTVKELAVYYRPERTWDDHMGNTDCGYYCIVPLPGGERRRVYMF